MKKELPRASGTYWERIKGYTAEEFEQIEALEEAIAKYEEEIQEFKNEIKRIERGAKARKRAL